jgi:hypothetical protein
MSAIDFDSLWDYSKPDETEKKSGTFEAIRKVE